jgi:hypothetical protein
MARPPCQTQDTYADQLCCSSTEATSTRYDLPRTTPIGLPIKTLLVTTPAPPQHCEKKACQRPQTNSQTTLYTSKPMLAATNTHNAAALQAGGSESSSTLSQACSHKKKPLVSCQANTHHQSQTPAARHPAHNHHHTSSSTPHNT